MSLYAKIAQVQAEIGGLKSDKTANVGQYKYDYITDSAMFAQVRGKLAPLGVATFVSVESEEQRDVMTVVHVKVTFVDESGEQFSIKGVGYGTDRADKGCGKAITSAVRYAFTKTFLQGGDEDPEQEYIERAPRVNGQATAPAPSPYDLIREQLDIIGPEGRKHLVKHLKATGKAPKDAGNANAWINAFHARWPGEDLREVLAHLVSTPLERQTVEDANAEKEAEGLFDEHAPPAVRSLPMYGEKAPS